MKFKNRAEKFIELEAIFPNDYLLNKKIDAKNKTISLTYGGEIIGEQEIEKIKSRLPNYDLQNTTLTILQGFAYLKDANSDDQKSQLNVALNIKDKQLQALQAKLDSFASKEQLSRQVFKELKTHYPNLESCILEKAVNHTDTVDQTIWIAMLKSNKSLHPEDQQKIEAWLKVRMNISKIKMHFE